VVKPERRQGEKRSGPRRGISIEQSEKTGRISERKRDGESSASSSIEGIPLSASERSRRMQEKTTLGAPWCNRGGEGGGRKRIHVRLGRRIGSTFSCGGGLTIEAYPSLAQRKKKSSTSTED